MGGRTFKDWLADTLDESGVSQRELARRLAGGDGPTDAESARRTISRILHGRVSPTDKTRRSIQEALGDFSAPSEGDEASDESTKREMAIDRHLSAIRELALGGN